MPVARRGATEDSSGISSVQLGKPRRASSAGTKRVRFHKVRSADGTLVEAWSNVAEGPTVLLCNGLGTSPYAWPELLDPDCGVHVVSWNHRGVGRSERPQDPDRVRVDAFVEDALAVLDDAGVTRCVVAGWSIGVNTAFELARRHPDRVSGLFAVAGVPGGSFTSMGAPLLIPRPLRQPIAVGVAHAMKVLGPALTPVTRRLPIGPVSSTALRWSGLMFPNASGGDVRRAVREFLTTPVDWYGHLAIAAAEHRRVSLSEIEVPACFVAGRFDVLASHHDMRTAADRLPGAEYVTLRGGHFLTLEQPKVVTALLREFVVSVEGPRAVPPPA
jgi:pimeloyl-ACP methyl ester carboxylesterase